MELFDATSLTNEPLAARMRPRNIEEYIGQEHLVGPGKLLRRLIKIDRISSLIFYGPPGTGKTTLAWVIANSTKCRFVVLNAVLSGVVQLREKLDEAVEQQRLYGSRTILFVDEVHRWNKKQQDALLPWVENGTIVLIGATTENPYFEVNPALVSRSRIFRLKKLSSLNMHEVITQVLDDKERGYGCYDVKLKQDARDHLVKTADGDARNLLNALELAIESTPTKFPPLDGEKILIDFQTIEDSIQQKAVLYDKEGDFHYDIISAFIKSIRGSDPDAALYWLARMIHAGENPRFIFRRMLISACEDIGLADPQAVAVVEADATAFDRVGLPEGRYMLTHSVLYLATTQKSNSALGFFDALKSVSDEQSADVPNHLKDAGRDSKEFGHGKGYLYPHAFRDHWTAQQYLPNALQGRLFYHPTKEGYEATIREELFRRRELQLETTLSTCDDENFSWSPENRKQSNWIKRAESSVSQVNSTIRDNLFNQTKLKRHSNVLILEESSALLYWEALRRSPEGGVYLLSDKQEISDHIYHYFEENQIDDQPLIVRGNKSNLADLNTLISKNRGLKFDLIIARNLLSGKTNVAKLLNECASWLSPEGNISFTQPDFENSTKLSDLVKGKVDNKFLSLIEELEKSIKSDDALYGWNVKKIGQVAKESGLELKKSDGWSFENKTKIESSVIQQWFAPSLSGYGKQLEKMKTGENVEELIMAVKKAISNEIVTWKRVERGYLLG